MSDLHSKFNLWLLQMKQLNSANMHLYVIWYFIQWHVVWCTQGLAFTLLIQVSILFLLLPFCFLFTIHVICTMHITYSMWNKVFSHTPPLPFPAHEVYRSHCIWCIAIYMSIYIERLWFAKWIRSKIMRNHKHLFTLFFRQIRSL